MPSDDFNWVGKLRSTSSGLSEQANVNMKSVLQNTIGFVAVIRELKYDNFQLLFEKIKNNK